MDGAGNRNDIIGAMIDFNAHILAGFGDGPENFDESVILVRKLVALGFDKIICAPRYYAKSDVYVSKVEKRQKIRELEMAAKKGGVAVELCVASEVFLIKNIDEMVQKGEVSLLGKSYVLIKMPERGRISLKKVEEVLIELRRKKYVPILTSPERSEFLQNDMKAVGKLSGTGAMFQCSFRTMAGLNGRKAEQLMKYMLERGFVDFLGTNVRDANDELFEKFDKAKKKIEKIVGEQGLKKIMRNAEGVI